jgi:hypothetical protein
MKIITISGIKLAGLREILEARVGIELYRFTDSTDVIDFTRCFGIAKLVKYARNA